MARLDDNELNIRPEVAAALGYPVRAEAQPRHTPPARQEESLGLPIFITLIVIVCLVCLVVAGIAHYQATTQSSQPQVSQQPVRVVGKKKQQSDAIQVGAAEPAPGVSDPATRVPVQRNDVQPPQEIQYAVNVQGPENAQSSDIEVNQRNEVPQYLPDDYDIGHVATTLTLLVSEMPRGGAVSPLGFIPEGTSLLYERANANGWRRVVSLDGRYVGYAQVYPTEAYPPQPMRPEFLEAIAMIRRIP